jgi:lipoate-protein ligase A
MNWQVLNTGRSSAHANMNFDREMLKKLDPEGPSILRLYEWAGDSATYGYFMTPFTYLKEEAVTRNQLQLARRPTGGGILFHLCDLTFSLFIPASHPNYSTNTLENYLFVNRHVSLAVHQFMGEKESLQLLNVDEKNCHHECNHFCMAQPSQYDVMLKGKKVGGGAQRRTKAGYLHQGTISLAMPSEEYLKDVLALDSPVLASMQNYAVSLLGSDLSSKKLNEARREMQQYLTSAFIKHE